MKEMAGGNNRMRFNTTWSQLKLILATLIVLLNVDPVYAEVRCSTITDSDGEDGFIFCSAYSPNSTMTYDGNLLGVPRIPAVSDPWSTVVYHNFSFDPTSNVSLAEIQPDAFNGLRVRELLLAGLNVSRVNPTAFRGLDVRLLTEIRLDANNISDIEPGTFDPVAACRLTLLSLTSNSLTRLRAATFSNLSSLAFLRLTDNALSDVDDAVFSPLTALNGIWLDHNRLTVVRAAWFHGLTELTWIQLNDNRIASIDSDSFVDQRQLEGLLLQNNHLVGVPNGLLAPSGSTLEFLDLSWNPITSLAASELDQLEMAYVSLIGVPLDCNSCQQLSELLLQLQSNNSVGGSPCSDVARCITTTTHATTVNLPITTTTATTTTKTTADATAVNIPITTTSATTTTKTTTKASKTTATPPTSTGGGDNSDQTANKSSGSSTSTGLIGGVVGGIVGGLCVVAVVVITVLIVRRRRRQQRSSRGVEKERNMTNFNDDAASGTGSGTVGSGGLGHESTKNLIFRLGSQPFTGKKSLFDTGTKQKPPVRVPRQGAEVATDGSPEVGQEDVSVAAKSGFKVVMNTNVVPQIISTVDCEEC